MQDDRLKSIENWSDSEVSILFKAGSYYYAGFLSGKGRSVILRTAYGWKSMFENWPLPEYDGSRLYPSGHTSIAWDTGCSLLHEKKYFKNEDEYESVLDSYKQIEHKLNDLINTCLGGAWGHSIPNYERLLKDGLHGCKLGIYNAMMKYRGWYEKEDFLNAMLIMYEGIVTYVDRIVNHLESLEFDEEKKESNRKRLIRGYRSVKEGAASTFEEAVIITNFLFHLDGCDGIGRFDQYLYPYYKKSMEYGVLTEDEAMEWVKDFLINVNQAGGWATITEDGHIPGDFFLVENLTLGGSTADGENASNELTVLVLKAGKGRMLPNLALRLREDTPENIWDEAMDCINGGSGNPALYCEENYLKSLEEAHLNIFKDDIYNYAFGGCTETMINGASFVGSTDAFLNVLRVLEEVMYEKLVSCNDYNELLEAYKARLNDEIYKTVESVNRYLESNSKYGANLVRSMFIDDCIEAAREYNVGGARYNWSTMGVAGLNNVIDSLYAVKEVIYKRKEISANYLLDVLRSNFDIDTGLQKKLLSISKFGNDCVEVNELGHELSSYIFREFRKYSCWRGGRIIPAIINMNAYDIFKILFFMQKAASRIPGNRGMSGRIKPAAVILRERPVFKHGFPSISST